ncbi:acetate kinase [Synechococcus sp. CS-1325]|uniref:acetate/propionate family kinase n=1 Tax=Synechococcus sp. CS-1325 TaxID=2847979 RepID=UPI000DB3FC2E|nr:acetate kinase [Synechococcus sp. CS-1325]MCT0200021.1 acetate kinase [Synechococcus sp. CS-1325]PZU99054.1 MAG: acetate kinase [Cyanobium sp.]
MTPELALVLNVGSSSLKACLIDRDGERVWQEQTNWASGGQSAGPAGALGGWLPRALAPWLDQITLVGHRVVHGGERFVAPTPITPELEGELEALVPLAPLHNGAALAVIRWLGRAFPALPQWACFDTGFHSSLPEAAYTYAIPASWRAGGLRRFGFHGLNHQHISEVVMAQQGHPPSLRLISCHLGAGCSLAAIRDGRSIDTTMGYTPLEGLVMASRSGSVDPGLLLHQLRHGLGVDQLERDLQQGSGLLGLSGLSGDMRELRQAAAAGHAGAGLALEVFLHRLLLAIGAMAASLGGVEVIALSGGIGQNDRRLLDDLNERLAWLQPVQLVQVPAEEEKMIARLCRRASRDRADRGSDGGGD